MSWLYCHEPDENLVFLIGSKGNLKMNIRNLNSLTIVMTLFKRVIKDSKFHIFIIFIFR